MLARSAQGLYWMGRYLERGERLCKMLGLQSDALVDRPLREIHFGWRRIYGSINRQPPGGIQEFDSDDYTLADSYTLADDLTFERSNPDSVWSCLVSGRENARQIRHCISGEMWTRLNLAYLRIQQLSIQDIWQTSPESFYAETAAEIGAFAGVADSTMYRDDGWRFMQLGRFIERAQLATALLLTQIPAGDFSDEDGDADSEEDWTSLLRVCHALEAYSRRYSVAVQPEQALDLLVTDPLLPDSLCRSLDMAAAELAGISPGPDAATCAAVQQSAGRLCAMIHYEWPEQADRRALLERVYVDCRELHLLVTAAYFEYPVEDLGRADGAGRQIQTQG